MIDYTLYYNTLVFTMFYITLLYTYLTKNSVNNTILAIFVVFLVTLTRNFSYDGITGDDFQTYYNYFLVSFDLTYFEYINKLERVEFIYLSYNYLIMNLFGEVPISLYLFFIVSPQIIIAFKITKYLKLEHFKLISVLLLLCSPGMVFAETHLLRQTSSFLIVLYAIVSYKNKVMISILFLTSYFIHNISIFLIFSYFIYKYFYKQQSKKNKNLILILMLIVSYFLSHYVISGSELLNILFNNFDMLKTKGYFLMDEERVRGIFNINTYFVLNVLLILYCLYITDDDPNIQVFFFIFYIIILLIIITMNMNAVSERFSVYIYSFQPIFIFTILLKLNNSLKYLFGFFYLLFYFLLYTNNVLGNNKIGLYGNSFY